MAVSAPVGRGNEILVGTGSGFTFSTTTSDTRGFDFTVGTAPIRVTSLGIWDNPSNDNWEFLRPGLNESHSVGLWSNSGSLLASVTVPSGTAASLVNEFRYVALTTPITLSAGATYILGANYSVSTNDPYRVNTGGNQAPSDPAITLNNTRYSFPSNSGFTFPAGNAEPGSLVGPNAQFTIAAVPPSQPRLFSLSLGVNDGQGVRGDLDAQRVQSVLSQHPTFASAALGNTSSALSLTNTASNVRLQIESALNSMQVNDNDTFVFYFSGHGGQRTSFSNDETAVTIDGAPNTGDEYLAAGSFDLTDDYLAELFDTSKWDGVRKVFLLDACYSGGFLGDNLTADFGDLERLSNFALFAASDEDSLAYTLASGRGLWTELALLPTLRDGVDFTELQDGIFTLARTVYDTFEGDVLFLRGINAPGSTGAVTEFSPFSAASADFDGSAPLLPETVPEPTSAALLFFGVALLARRRILTPHERNG